MSLIEHARRELELCGQTAKDPAYAASLVAAVATFASYGHSGGSAACATAQLHELLQYRTLSPITSDPDEWIDQSEISGTPLWQNARDSAAMSRDGGNTWYFVDDRKASTDNETEQTEDAQSDREDPITRLKAALSRHGYDAGRLSSGALMDLAASVLTDRWPS